MQRIIYNKLVRDGIPAIIQQSGRKYEAQALSRREFEKALLSKLIEEANEVREAFSKSDMEIEIADLFEVMDTLVACYNLDREKITGIQIQRRRERGGYDKKVRLNWVEQVDDELKID